MHKISARRQGKRGVPNHNGTTSVAKILRNIARFPNPDAGYLFSSWPYYKLRLFGEQKAGQNLLFPHGGFVKDRRATKAHIQSSNIC